MHKIRRVAPPAREEIISKLRLLAEELKEKHGIKKVLPYGSLALGGCP